MNPSIFTGNDRPQCLDNTRKETLQNIYNWVNAEGYPNIFLLIGAAGAGKSTTATTVAGVYQRRRQLGCHIFFVRGRSQPGDVFQTIAYSLSVHNQTMAETLVSHLKDIGDLEPSNLKTKFEILLREPLSAIATSVRSPTLIVLDALDECGTPETRRNLMNILYDELLTLPPNYRFLITARPEEDILPFVSLSPLAVHALNLDYRIEESRLDVYTYTKHELEKLKSSKSFVVPQDWDWDEGIRRLADTADGLFIWASTAVRFVKEEKLSRSRYRCFERLVSNANSLKLDELYKTVLDHALEWNEEYKNIFRSIFSLILFAKRPLSDKEINEILDLEDVTSDVLSYFRSLVRYEEGQPIKIYHASFYDYLISCEGSAWYIDVGVERENIARRCLERMGKSLRHNICKILPTYVLNRDVPDLDERMVQCIPPSLKYICCNWAHHLRDVTYSQELCSRLQSFAHNQLLFWFEVLSLTNTFNNNVGPALQFAIDWIGVSALYCFECLVTKYLSRTMTRNYHLSLEMHIDRQAYIRSQSR